MEKGEIIEKHVIWKLLISFNLRKKNYESIIFWIKVMDIINILKCYFSLFLCFCCCCFFLEVFSVYVQKQVIFNIFTVCFCYFLLFVPKSSENYCFPMYGIVYYEHLFIYSILIYWIGFSYIFFSILCCAVKPNSYWKTKTGFSV